jgi:hypothetical protein
MKRSMMVAALLLAVCLVASCQTKVVVGQSLEVEWDAPSLGTIPPAEVTYEVGIQGYPSGAFTLIATVPGTGGVVTFAAEGAYRVMVRTVRTVVEDGTVLPSEWAKSDEVGTPSPWYVVFYATPGSVIRIRIR